MKITSTIMNHVPQVTRSYHLTPQVRPQTPAKQHPGSAQHKDTTRMRKIQRSSLSTTDLLQPQGGQFSFLPNTPQSTAGLGLAGWLADPAHKSPHPAMPHPFPAGTFEHGELGTSVDLSQTVGGRALIDGFVSLHPQWLDPQHRSCPVVKLNDLPEDTHMVTACSGQTPGPAQAQPFSCREKAPREGDQDEVI